jgi:hypothetical protein
MKELTERELALELLKAKRKMNSLPLDCDDRTWERHVKNVKHLELELSKK